MYAASSSQAIDLLIVSERPCDQRRGQSQRSGSAAAGSGRPRIYRRSAAEHRPTPSYRARRWPATVEPKATAQRHQRKHQRPVRQYLPNTDLSGYKLTPSPTRSTTGPRKTLARRSTRLPARQALGSLTVALAPSAASYLSSMRATRVRTSPDGTGLIVQTDRIGTLSLRGFFGVSPDLIDRRLALVGFSRNPGCAVLEVINGLALAHDISL
jgi:hypothetical protein